MATPEVDLIVSAVPTPVLVADYTPIIDRFDGMTYENIRRLLETDDDVFQETLTLPDPIASNPEWVRLYGAPDSTQPPNFEERSFTKEAYPELYATLIEQFTAPFRGTTSIVREHTAPTLVGDVAVRSHWKALEDESGPTWDRIVIVDFDMTELRNAQNTLESLLATKDQLMTSKDELIASVSHEIRTPLSSIVGFAELLKDASDLDEDERNEMVELLVQQSGDLTNIVDDLLVAAKSDLGRMEVASVPIDLKAQAAQAIEATDSGRARIIGTPTDPARCLGDPARVRQIARNLLSNAIKYGGPEIRIDTSVRGDFGVLEVRDNGAGVSDENRERIFDAYDRGDQTSGPTSSLGLGLHISRRLAHRMGGDLTYRYENDESVFELKLPLADQG